LFDGFIERLHIDEHLPIVSEEILQALDRLESPNILDCGYGTGIWIHELLNVLDDVDNEGVSQHPLFARRLAFDGRL
jgi:predicted TPR repeat methyltransferase